MDSAVSYYEDGVKLDPTWAQGWYNAALLYAEQRDYAHAALSMKHYLILLPDAPDAAPAKQKMLLWEAKAEEAAGK
jgi:regulator of sirC expression with transglutaminase-like and TPR domain